MSEDAIRSGKDVAATFPVPSDELADRLVDLLLPRECAQSEAEEAA